MTKKEKIVALKLPKSEYPLDERQQKYLDVCQEKLGFVPNVLAAYAWHGQKLAGFSERRINAAIDFIRHQIDEKSGDPCH